MGSYNGFTHAVANGEITELKEFFWYYVSRNRRDQNERDPVLLYKWNEEHEQIRISKAEAELAEALATTDLQWEAQLQESRTNRVVSRIRMEDDKVKELVRLRAMVDQFDRAHDTLHPDLVEWHEHVVKMFHSDIAHNSPREVEEDKMTTDRFKELMVDGCRRHVENSKDRYEIRKKNCLKRSAFLRAAIERYGEPSCSIKIVDSSEMW
jgi:hypothetical protein